MREIKFRAWDKEQKRLVYDFETTPYFNSRVIAKYSVKDCMQYTELKDRNGVEIYEGDIIRTYHPFSKFDYNDEKDFVDGEWLAIWEAPRFIFKPINDIGIGVKTKPNGELTEVIGNIYENPELLEANQ